VNNDVDVLFSSRCSSCYTTYWFICTVDLFQMTSALPLLERAFPEFAVWNAGLRASD